ncbi:MAG: aminopeptidase P family protein [Anaerolineales bacterium]|nr:aminopeptidase P family protein [Anaerolineales bacterium]
MDLLSEYCRRVNGIRDAMERENLDALLVYSWKRGAVRYLSNYAPNFIANVALVVLPRTGPPTLCIRFPFDLERAARVSWIEDVRACGDVPAIASEVVRILDDEGLFAGRIGLVTGDDIIDEMPHSLYSQLEKELPWVTFVTSSNLLVESRTYKSRLEFDLLRRSARLADEAVSETGKQLAPGQSEFKVVAFAEAVAKERGASASLVTIASRDQKMLIGPPVAAILETRDRVILEAAVQVDGYWTQVARTFSLGSPDRDQCEIYSLVYDAYQAGVSAAQPGNTCAMVAQTITDVLERSGYADFLQVDLGHGIGIDLPETPRIKHEENKVIEPGMALVIHPAVHVPGKGRAFLGGTILVHESGPEPIHDIPDKLL